MGGLHPSIDLSQPIPIRAPMPIPEPVIVETPTTFESNELLGLGIIAGTGAGLFVGWQLCNLIVSTEFYQNFARDLLLTIIPIRKIKLISGVAGVAIELIAAALGVSVPELE